TLLCIYVLFFLMFSLHFISTIFSYTSLFRSKNNYLLLLESRFFMANTEKFNWKKNIPLFAVLLSGAFVTILNQTLLGTALPPIMKDLNLTESTAQWLQSVFMLVNGIMIPVTAFLIDRFTTRRLFLTAMGLFTIGTFIAAIAPSFSVLMTG